MRFDVEKIIFLQTVMKALSQGIDPTSNIAFPDDTILNSKILQSCFSDSYVIFNFLRRNIDEINNLYSQKGKNRKAPFQINDVEIEKIQLSDIPITISKFVFSINEVCHSKDMKKLKATQITSWLNEHGYLKDVKLKDGMTCKRATVYGEEIGITSITKVNSKGIQYFTNMYNKDAQQFILKFVIPHIEK